ncbi:MAG TPA: hypothetical protein VJ370_05760 [Streptosporangiaceae bacterium]|jgi:hypothetical protein|nr:hypothetical protein [Streptosporangiaceae bacterium]HJZ25766.1 hypothetical protein [Streptosporangiaceae bacterium]
MLAHLSRSESGPRTAARQAGARLRRAAAVLAAVTCGLLAWAAAVPAAFAQPKPIGDGGTSPFTPVRPATVHVISTGGMAGWQITLIAIGAALAGAAAVLLIDRAWVARRATPAPTA